MTTRRHFILKSIPVVALSLSASEISLAQPAKIEETDATAVALGYKHDASKVDTKKFPAYVSGRTCANCLLFQGKATDSWSSCNVMGGKLVSAKGWCAAWSKKN